MSVNMWDVRTMIAALEQMHPPTTFLLDTFFKEENYSKTDVVDIDVVKGKRKLAPLVSPLAQGTVVERLGYTTNTIRPPYIKPKMKTTAEDLLKRFAGQHMYMQNDNPAILAAQQEGKDLAYLQDLIVRREEWMAAQLLNAGKVILTGEGINAEVDFLMNATHKIAVGTITAWDQTNADPLSDLSTWGRLVKKDSGLVPNICIMGQDASVAFLSHANVQKYFDLRKVDMGEIKPSLLPNGAEFLGTLRYPGAYFDIYTYSEIYEDENSVEQYYVPLDKVWIGSQKARCVRQYAVIHDLRCTAQVRWFPKTWEVEDPSCRWLMVQSAPLPSLHQSDAFLSAEVL